MKNKLSALRTVVSLILVACYFVGLIFMVTGLFYAGVILWAVSTVGGIGLLYYIRTTDRTKETLPEALKEEKDLENAPENAEAPVDTEGNDD